MKSAYL